MSFSPGALFFGNQIYGTTSAARTETLTNSGSATLHIASLTIAGANPADFAQTNSCGASLASGASCSINVTFTPTNTGSRTAYVSLSDDAPNSPQTVNLTGSGATSVSFSPKSINFVSRVVGSTSLPVTVTVTNKGNSLAIQTISISGPNTGDFAETNNCGSPLGAGASCSISITFAPSAGGSRTASLAVYDGDPTSPQVVSLTGTGTTAPAVTLSPGSLTFGNQVVGTKSAAQAVTLTNRGSASLNFTSIAITGQNSTDFTQTNNCGASLAASASCTINVTFTPDKANNRAASMKITDNASPSTQTVSLSGTGT